MIYQNVAQLGSPLQVVGLLITKYSFIFLFMAVGAWIMAQRIMRGVSTIVAYHRKGTGVTIYKASEQGSVLQFLPKKGRLFAKRTPIDLINVKIEANPETQVTGLRTFRLHHVIEGFNRTVDIRQIPVLLAKLYLRARGIPLGAGMEGTSGATALATMQSAFTVMGQSFPRTKGEYIINLVYATAGLGWGIVTGYFIFK